MYKALVSFSGKVTMSAGDVREIADTTIAEDLLKAGYIESLEPKKKEEKKKKKND